MGDGANQVWSDKTWGQRTKTLVRSSLWCLLLGLLVFDTAYASLHFTRQWRHPAAAWPVNALLFAVITRRRSVQAIAVVIVGCLADCAAHMAIGDGALASIAYAACDALEILTCVWALRSFLRRTLDLTRQKHVLSFLFAAGILAPVTSAAAGAALAMVLHREVRAAAVQGWYVAHALGFIVVGPALLAINRSAFRELRRKLSRGKVGFSFLVLAAVMATISWQNQHQLLFLLPPALIFVAFELGQAGAAAAILLCGLALAALSVRGLGPIPAKDGDLSTRLALMQGFLATMTLAILPIAAALAKRNRLQVQLQASLRSVEASQRGTAEALRVSTLASQVAGVGQWRLDLQTRKSTWSKQTYVIHGLSPAEPAERMQKAIMLYDESDRPHLAKMINDVTHGGEAMERKVWMTRADDGARRTVIHRAEAERGANGRPTAVIGVVRDVTDEETALRRIEESEARYRLLADTTSDLIIKVGLDDAIQYISPSCRGFGFEPEHLMGARSSDWVHPDDLPRMQLVMTSLVRTGALDPSMDQTYRIRTKDHGYVWVEGAPALACDAQGRPEAVISQLRDISERKAADLALADNEERYRAIAENASDIITRADVQGRLIYLSPSVEQILGFSPSDLVGEPMQSLVHPDDVDRVDESFGAFLVHPRGERRPIVFRGRHRSGEYLWLECNPTPLFDPEGAVAEFISVTRDVSARVALEAELRSARDSAQAAAAVKSDFMANMSHEIRTPLTAILGFTRLLGARGDLSEEAKSYVIRVAGAGEALLALVNDVLDFSKLEAGQVVIEHEPTSASALLNDALHMFAPQADAKGLTLSFEADPKLPKALFIDRHRVRQVMLNLIGNAVKFTDEGVIVVQADYDETGERLIVKVCDTGPGLSPAQQNKLFKRFSQVDGSTTRRHSGTGLGLAICKGLAEAMGGSMGVYSVVGEGSIFSLELPARPVELMPLAQASAVDHGLAGARVLVVDDNPLNRELARALLQPLHVEVSEAADGAGAIEMAKTVPFDVILMDLRMPGVDGATAAASIRRTPGPNREIPILAFSADTEGPSDGEARLAFDGVVGKPLDPKALIAALVKCLDWPGGAYAPMDAALP